MKKWFFKDSISFADFLVYMTAFFLTSNDWLGWLTYFTIVTLWAFTSHKIQEKL